MSFAGRENVLRKGNCRWSIVNGLVGDPAAAGFNSPLPGPGGQHGGGNPAGDLLDGIIDIDESMAEALGITVNELETAKEEGKRVCELIDELGFDAETVHQEVQDAVEAAVEQAVTDGLLSEEEAESILNQPSGQEGRPGPGGPGAREDGEMPAPGDETSTEGQTFRGPGAGGVGGRGGRR